MTTRRALVLRCSRGRSELRSSNLLSLCLLLSLKDSFLRPLRGGGGEEIRPMRILLGLSGSVAAIKAKELVEGLGGAERVRVVVTGRATSFFDVDEVCTATGVKVYTDEDEWGAWKQRGDPVRVSPAGEQVASLRPPAHRAEPVGGRSGHSPSVGQHLGQAIMGHG
mmetsp:Transcript_52710/g.163556  ORF Transcript_52710/g.163556 Transcript_52710/m.163556 type:complete len:166 (-) Transcript_52710:403-900(-)